MTDHPDETARLAALKALGLLDTLPDPRFDTVTELARDVFDTPIALVSLIDEHRQWFKSNCGLTDVSETPRELAFCAHAIQGEDVMVVEDSRTDPRFADNALVTGPPHVIFYAGAPLRLPGGAAIGTLCIIDHKPRSFDAASRRRLARMADMVLAAIDTHRLMSDVSRLAETNRQSEALSTAILESSEAGVISYRPIRDEAGEITDFAIVAANPANTRMIGRTPEYLRATTFLTEFPSNRETGLFDAYRHISRSGEPLLQELFTRDEGLNDWFRVSAVRTGEDGVTATFYKITDRKRMETTLRGLHDLSPLLTSALQQHLDGILKLGCDVLDLESGVISDIADGAYRIRTAWGDIPGIAPGAELPLQATMCAEVVATGGIVAIDAITDDQCEAHPAVRQAGFKCYIGAPVQVAGRIRGAISFASRTLRDRPMSPVDADLVDLFASSVSHAIAFEEALRQLRDVQDELRLVLDNVPARIWYKDDANTILRVNRAALESMGLSDASEAEGRRTEDLFPEMAAKYLADDLDVIRRGEPVRNIIESYAPTTGVEGWISTDKIPMTDAAGRNFILAVSTDITEARRQEELLRRLNENLEQFAFVAAHDLQAPLRQCAMFVDLLVSEMASAGVDPGPHALQYAAELGAALRRMRAMVQSLYDLFALRPENITLQRRNLGDLARTAADQAAGVIAASRARVEIGDMPDLEVNAPLMIQVFQNLIVNACKYAGTPEPVIRIHGRRDVVRRRATVVFEDNGVGIPAEHRERIFEPFRRLQRHGDVEGSGIGLALVRRIVSMHRGDIVVDPDCSTGARFVIDFGI